MWADNRSSGSSFEKAGVVVVLTETTKNGWYKHGAQASLSRQYFNSIARFGRFNQLKLSLVCEHS